MHNLAVALNGFLTTKNRLPARGQWVITTNDNIDDPVEERFTRFLGLQKKGSGKCSPIRMLLSWIAGLPNSGG